MDHFPRHLVTSIKEMAARHFHASITLSHCGLYFHIALVLRCFYLNILDFHQEIYLSRKCQMVDFMGLKLAALGGEMSCTD